jgi:ergothioneine biosynthesis protein EgtB
MAAAMTSIARRFASTREATQGLVEGLSAEDCLVQSMPDASPVKWHLAHTTWFFETFILETAEPGFRPFDPAFRMLFNSYYQSVGPRHSRASRGVLSRPSLAQVADYRRNVGERITALLDAPLDPALLALVELGIAHEQQHQELILTDLLHHFSCNPLLPAFRSGMRAPGLAGPQRFRTYAGGIVEIGHSGPGFAFDNESPRHRVWLEPFALAERPVSQGDYLGFIEDGGYDRAEFWLAEGWDLRTREAWSHPLYWQRGADGLWRVFGLDGLQALDPARPASNLSYFEADAYARWAGARLPSEMEWEHAAQGGELANTGLVWEWTRSAYAAYPGFAPMPNAVGEYNGKFMINQMVLRGGSHATPAGHLRPSYRNFFPPAARWQFSGLRLARAP